VAVMCGGTIVERERGIPTYRQGRDNSPFFPPSMILSLAS